ARSQADPNEDDNSDEGEVGNRPRNTLKALRENLSKKYFSEDTVGTHMINVTLKSSKAAEKSNEIALLALEKHNEQTIIINQQRERELAQSQTRLELDSQMARDTLSLRREELTAATLRQEREDGQIHELKSSMVNVQGTLAEMGSVLKLLVERLPAGNGSS
ncbi:hypothetical protein DFH28DRAFT_897440, partial [Melampsora americana]